MSDHARPDFALIRAAMAGFEPSPKVSPNEEIEPDRVFFPQGHRGVLDFRRQLVVGNRGMGKSFWTHALGNSVLRERLASAYGLVGLRNTEVVIGFNGSERIAGIAPTLDEIKQALETQVDPDLIWRATLLRAVGSHGSAQTWQDLSAAIHDVQTESNLYARVLTAVDDRLVRDGKSLLVVFDALDRLPRGWDNIRRLSKGLLIRALGLQSFRSIRAKIFMRVDQFGDPDLFSFPDSSKVKNDVVDLTWHPHELYSLLFFEILRNTDARGELEKLADMTGTRFALPQIGQLDAAAPDIQDKLVSAIAGEFMGSHKKRGRVYSWVPLHLSDAANNCAPRTFLTAWKSAADHNPAPIGRAVDHLGLFDGVRHASNSRLTELREDFPWINAVLNPLRRQFVPIPREELFELWQRDEVIMHIFEQAEKEQWLPPIDVFVERNPAALLRSMRRIAVMEERANGKINVPDIFRVEADILRKGGVAVPRRR